MIEKIKKELEYSINTVKYICSKVFKRPVDGVKEIIVNTPDPKQMGYHLVVLNTIVISLSAFLATPSMFLNKLGWTVIVSGIFLPAIWMGLICLFTYLTKLYFKKKTSFRKEILVAGLAGVPLSIFMLIVMVFSFIFWSDNIYDMIIKANILALPSKLAFIFCLLYIHLIVKKGFTIDGINKNKVFYIAPLIILTVYYLGWEIWVSVFF